MLLPVTECKHFLALKIYVKDDDTPCLFGIQALEKMDSVTDIRQNSLKAKKNIFSISRREKDQRKSEVKIDLDKLTIRASVIENKIETLCFTESLNQGTDL